MQKVSVHVLGPIQDMLARPHPASASTFFFFLRLNYKTHLLSLVHFHFRLYNFVIFFSISFIISHFIQCSSSIHQVTKRVLFY